MKLLFNCHTPFMLAHGGAQVQIEQTQAALEQVGVQVEPLRWWDDKQTGDLLHHFGRIPVNLIRLAHKKGIKVVMFDLLGGASSRSALRLQLEYLVRSIGRHLFPQNMLETLSWESYRLADACVALTAWEASLMQRLFEAPADRIHVIPNGVEQVFLESKPAQRGPWLVITATITEQKRIVELAQAAVLAETPLWVIGKPYSQTSSYAGRFVEMTKQHPQLLRYEGPINDRATLARTYREARGFVLLSTYESLSLSALEAAACGCPLLLSDLPWARTSFGAQASYCPVGGPRQTAPSLKTFYAEAPQRPEPARPLSWLEVAQQLKRVYESLLSTSR
jgi:glycosyltransferase involved in cell wall biosynthesis